MKSSVGVSVSAAAVDVKLVAYRRPHNGAAGPSGHEMGVSLFSSSMIQLLLCRLLSTLDHVICAGSGAVPLDKSFVLEYLVVEELPPKTLIGSVPRDYQLNRKYSPATLGELRFRFLSRPGGGLGDRTLFALDEVSGVLSTAGRIDREVICPGLAECFVAFDVAVHPMMYFQIVKIRVEIVDVNDNVPVFPQPTVSLELSEAAEIGATLPLPSAVDFDAGENGACEYRLLPPQDHFLLQVILPVFFSFYVFLKIPTRSSAIAGRPCDAKACQG